ncbi:zeta toxin family protein [Vampirovibrio sp.]|uniref:zeta toxin family protein n=1 Tax=Vampirovibrio sp. TaxID=2717857 RepID=UPI003592F975
MSKSSSPLLIVIGGPNGAGKTTAAMAVLPEALSLVEFLNADEIAKGLSPLNPSSVDIQAGRLLLERAHHFLEKGISFGFESTLAASTPVKLMKEAKGKGYQVVLLYFWLSSPQLSMERIRQRVRNGGHHIPDDVVLRRYERSMDNLKQKYIPLADVWLVFDNSNDNPVLIAEGEQEANMIHVYNDSTWQQLMKGAQT